MSGERAIVGDMAAAAARGGETVFSSTGAGGGVRAEGRKRKRAQRAAERCIENDDGSGVWATHKEYEAFSDDEAGAEAAADAEALADSRGDKPERGKSGSTSGPSATLPGPSFVGSAADAVTPVARGAANEGIEIIELTK